MIRTIIVGISKKKFSIHLQLKSKKGSLYLYDFAEHSRGCEFLGMNIFNFSIKRHNALFVFDDVINESPQFQIRLQRQREEHVVREDRPCRCRLRRRSGRF
jgi:hypothetical protein